MAHVAHVRLGGAAHPGGTLGRRAVLGAARRPPVALRAAVVLLAVLLLDGLACLGALSLHPAWFAGLRRTVPAPVPRARERVPVASAPTASPTPTGRATPVRAAPATQAGHEGSAADGAGGTGLRFVGASPTVTTYSVPRAPFTIAFAVDQPCWVTLRTPPSAGSPAFAATLLPTRPTAITVRGPASVMVAARATAIEIRYGTHAVGRIEAPVVGMTYRLVPRAG